MVVHIKAGNGGSGAVSFATGKYVRVAAAGTHWFVCVFANILRWWARWKRW